METALKALDETCSQSISALQLAGYEVEGPWGQAAVSFDLRGWRTRLEQISRQLETAGTALCDWSRAGQEPSLPSIQSLVVGIEVLVRHVRRFPPARGRPYLRAICDVAISVVTALRRIVQLLPRSHISLIEPYQWNQTRRLRDLAHSPLEHLLSSWEGWLGMMREALEEAQRLAAGEHRGSATPTQQEAIDDEDDQDWEGEMIRSMAPAEFAMVRDCAALIKLARGLMKKVRLKCINSLAADSFTDIHLIDSFYDLGHHINAQVDNLAASLFPSHDGLVIRQSAIGLCRMAQDLAEIAKASCSETSQQWFESCSVQFDKLLSPVIERTPFR